MFRPTLPGYEQAWNVRLLYLLACLTTVSEGAFELAFPLDLHHARIALPWIGWAMAAVSLGMLAARLPGGAWYAPRSVRLLNAGAQAVFGLAKLGIALTGVFGLQFLLGGVQGFAFGLVTTWQLAILIEVRPGGRRTATVMAWYTAAISLGYALGALLGAGAIARFGQPGAIAVAGGVALLAGMLTLALRPLPARAEVEPPPTQPPPPRGGRTLGLVLSLPASIWLASLLVLYINFVSDTVDVYFPIYGLAIGLSLGFIGGLRSMNSLVASGIRFLLAVIFRVAAPMPLTHACVVAMALALLALSALHQPWVLVVAFLALGLSRGVVRVTTTTAVAEERERLGPAVGLASAVYNAGLDIGGMLAPPVAGVLAGALGIPAAFRSVAIALPLAYYGLWLVIRLLGGRVPRSTPRPEPSVPSGTAPP